MLAKKSRKRNKKSNETEEDPERLSRTVFVGNLPVAFTRKVSNIERIYDKTTDTFMVCLENKISCLKFPFFCPETVYIGRVHSICSTKV